MYFVSDAGGGWNVRVRLQAKAGGAMGCAIATTLGMMLQTTRQLSEMAFGSIFVSTLAVMECCGRIACARSSIAPEVRRSPPIFTCTRSCRHIAPKVATLTADTTFITRGRHMTDHTVACISPLTHCPSYLQALEPSARPVQVFR